VQGECYENWLFFFISLLHGLNAITKENVSEHRGLVFMSDREKGLAKAAKEVFPQIPHSHCCQHIAANIQTLFNIAARELFWPIAYAVTKDAFDSAFTGLMKKNPAAAEYVKKIPAEHYITWCFPRPRYGQLTSNIVESMNRKWKAIRAMHSLRMLTTIWTSIMETFAHRGERNNVDSTLTDVAKKSFSRRYESSRK
jgi:hypothetical protein